MRLSAFALLLAAAFPLAGCKSTMTVRMNEQATASTKDADAAPPPPSSDAMGQRPKTAFVGVTQALSLSDDALTKATCRCLAAAVGSPRDPAFQWRGSVPPVGDDAIVVAVGSSDKTPCDAGAGTRRPSIQGVDSEGTDIVVTLEEPGPGIPEARGAVIQRPSFDGGYLVFRTGRRLPYGQPLPGSQTALCRVPLGGSTAAAKPTDATTTRSLTTRPRIQPPVNTF